MKKKLISGLACFALCLFGGLGLMACNETSAPPYVAPDAISADTDGTTLGDKNTLFVNASDFALTREGTTTTYNVAGHAHAFSADQVTAYGTDVTTNDGYVVIKVKGTANGEFKGAYVSKGTTAFPQDPATPQPAPQDTIKTYHFEQDGYQELVLRTTGTDRADKDYMVKIGNDVYTVKLSSLTGVEEKAAMVSQIASATLGGKDYTSSNTLSKVTDGYKLTGSYSIFTKEQLTTFDPEEEFTGTNGYVIFALEKVERAEKVRLTFEGIGDTPTDYPYALFTDGTSGNQLHMIVNVTSGQRFNKNLKVEYVRGEGESEVVVESTKIDLSEIKVPELIETNKTGNLGGVALDESDITIEYASDNVYQASGTYGTLTSQQATAYGADFAKVGSGYVVWGTKVDAGTKILTKWVENTEKVTDWADAVTSTTGEANDTVVDIVTGHKDKSVLAVKIGNEEIFIEFNAVKAPSTLFKALGEGEHATYTADGSVPAQQFANDESLTLTQDANNDKLFKFTGKYKLLTDAQYKAVKGNQSENNEESKGYVVWATNFAGTTELLDVITWQPGTMQGGVWTEKPDSNATPLNSKVKDHIITTVSGGTTTVAKVTVAGEEYFIDLSGLSPADPIVESVTSLTSVFDTNWEVNNKFTLTKTGTGYEIAGEWIPFTTAQKNGYNDNSVVPGADGWVVYKVMLPKDTTIQIASIDAGETKWSTEKVYNIKDHTYPNDGFWNVITRVTGENRTGKNLIIHSAADKFDDIIIDLSKLSAPANPVNVLDSSIAALFPTQQENPLYHTEFANPSDLTIKQVASTSNDEAVYELSGEYAIMSDLQYQALIKRTNDGTKNTEKAGYIVLTADLATGSNTFTTEKGTLDNGTWQSLNEGVVTHTNLPAKDHVIVQIKSTYDLSKTCLKFTLEGKSFYVTFKGLKAPIVTTDDVAIVREKAFTNEDSLKITKTGDKTYTISGEYKRFDTEHITAFGNESLTVDKNAYVVLHFNLAKNTKYKYGFADDSATIVAKENKDMGDDETGLDLVLAIEKGTQKTFFIVINDEVYTINGWNTLTEAFVTPDEAYQGEQWFKNQEGLKLVKTGANTYKISGKYTKFDESHKTAFNNESLTTENHAYVVLHFALPSTSTFKFGFADDEQSLTGKEDTMDGDTTGLDLILAFSTQSESKNFYIVVDDVTYTITGWNDLTAPEEE